MSSAATSSSKSRRAEQLTVGSHVFHRAHGVAEVVGIERRTIGEAQPRFYVLELVAGGRILLPMDNVKRSAVRALISATHARRLLKLVATEPELDDEPLRERSERYADTLKAGEADTYTEILRQLLLRSTSGTLNMTERRYLDAARSYFVHEIGTVLGRSAQQIEGQLPTGTGRSKSKK